MPCTDRAIKKPDAKDVYQEWPGVAHVPGHPYSRCQHDRAGWTDPRGGPAAEQEPAEKYLLYDRRNHDGLPHRKEQEPGSLHFAIMVKRIGGRLILDPG